MSVYFSAGAQVGRKNSFPRAPRCRAVIVTKASPRMMLHPSRPLTSAQRSMVLFQRAFQAGRLALMLSQSTVIAVFM